ncbi:hypothetical protein L916_08812 [Phytophthora nicotianae]|uniref:Uncharacterized protein n=1 Tax=Phytophthora nicotianae TaxID=4792 RepID=W2J2N9_PHYNI|nr:hypothetical protein L916_08812 [Phytophthora nicotianae]
MLGFCYCGCAGEQLPSTGNRSRMATGRRVLGIVRAGIRRGGSSAVCWTPRLAATGGVSDPWQ